VASCMIRSGVGWLAFMPALLAFALTVRPVARRSRAAPPSASRRSYGNALAESTYSRSMNPLYRTRLPQRRTRPITV